MKTASAAKRKREGASWNSQLMIEIFRHTQVACGWWLGMQNSIVKRVYSYVGKDDWNIQHKSLMVRVRRKEITLLNDYSPVTDVLISFFYSFSIIFYFINCAHTHRERHSQRMWLFRLSIIWRNHVMDEWSTLWGESKSKAPPRRRQTTWGDGSRSTKACNSSLSSHFSFWHKSMMGMGKTCTTYITYLLFPVSPNWTIENAVPKDGEKDLQEVVYPFHGRKFYQSLKTSGGSIWIRKLVRILFLSGGSRHTSNAISWHIEAVMFCMYEYALLATV